MNITENRAADFGVSGPLAYFGQMLSYWQLAAIPLLMLARSVKPYQPLFWAAVVNLGVHMLIGHKEYRFIFLSRSEEHTSELQSLMRHSYAVFCLKTKKHLI